MMHLVTGIWYRAVEVVAARLHRSQQESPSAVMLDVEQAWLATIASMLEYEMAQSYREIADDNIGVSFRVRNALLERSKHHANRATQLIDFATELLSNAREASRPGVPE